MPSPTLDDLRGLARRSRRTHLWGIGTLAGALAIVPGQLFLADLVPAGRLALAAVALGGALLLSFAYIAGQERGAYRKLFRELKRSKDVKVATAEPAGQEGVGPREAA